MKALPGGTLFSAALGTAASEKCSAFKTPLICLGSATLRRAEGDVQHKIHLDKADAAAHGVGYVRACVEIC